MIINQIKKTQNPDHSLKIDIKSSTSLSFKSKFLIPTYTSIISLKFFKLKIIANSNWKYFSSTSSFSAYFTNSNQFIDSFEYLWLLDLLDDLGLSLGGFPTLVISWLSYITGIKCQCRMIFTFLLGITFAGHFFIFLANWP